MHCKQQKTPYSICEPFNHCRSNYMEREKNNTVSTSLHHKDYGDSWHLISCSWRQEGKKKARCRAFAVFAIITGTSVVQEPALTCASTVNWDEKKLWKKKNITVTWPHLCRGTTNLKFCNNTVLNKSDAALQMQHSYFLCHTGILFF